MTPHGTNHAMHDPLPTRPSDGCVLYRKENKSSRRAFVASGIAAGAILASPRASLAIIDINNAIAGDFQRYPGLFPTIAAKVGPRVRGMSGQWQPLILCHDSY